MGSLLSIEASISQRQIKAIFNIKKHYNMIDILLSEFSKKEYDLWKLKHLRYLITTTQQSYDDSPEVPSDNMIDETK